MIKVFFLVLTFLLVAASRNNVEDLRARRLLQKANNNTSVSLGAGDEPVEFNNTEGSVSRRSLFHYIAYNKYPGRDRDGGDIGCGHWGTHSHSAIKRACNRRQHCIGYTTRNGRPWCLKTSQSSANMYPKRGHDYYAKNWSHYSGSKCPTEPGRCGPKFFGAYCTGGELRPYDKWCNEDNGWCGDTSAHKNAQSSTRYDGSEYKKCVESVFYG